MATRRVRRGFVERNIGALAEALEYAAFADKTARNGGLLQGLDPRVKIIGAVLLILAAVSARNMASILGVFAVAAGLAMCSRIPLRVLATRVWGSALAFTGALAMPAVFLTPGELLCRVPLLHWPITAQGVQTAVRLVARAETTATLALALILSTPWPHVLKALRVLRVPVVAVVILGMTHRYLFLLLGLARDFFEARRSRQVGPLDAARSQQVAAAASGVLLGRSLYLSGEVFSAMQSRGFRGEIRTLDDFQLRRRDGIALAVLFALAGVAFWAGAR